MNGEETFLTQKRFEILFSSKLGRKKEQNTFQGKEQKAAKKKHKAMTEGKRGRQRGMGGNRLTTTLRQKAKQFVSTRKGWIRGRNLVEGKRFPPE